MGELSESSGREGEQSFRAGDSESSQRAGRAGRRARERARQEVEGCGTLNAVCMSVVCSFKPSKMKLFLFLVALLLGAACAGHGA